MSDAMLSILYERAFQVKREVDSCEQGEHGDRLRQVAIEKGALLYELIDIRTDQIRNGASDEWHG